VSSPYSSFGEPVAIDAAGNAVAVAVLAKDYYRTATLAASFRPVATGAWEPPVDLAGTVSDLRDVDVAFDPAGNAIVVFASKTGVAATFRPFGGTWSHPVTIGQPSAQKVVLSVSRSGAVVVWDRSGIALEAASRPAGSDTWSDPIPLAEHVTDFDLAADPEGNAAVVWTESRGARLAIRSRLRPAASQNWEPPMDVASVPWIPSYGGRVRLSLDGHGNGLAVWSMYDAATAAVFLSELRAGGPVLSKLSIPAAGAARMPLRFAVDPVPWSSRVATLPNWAFGDGTSTVGTRVTHVYSRPGTYTVSVEAGDADGGVSRSTATVAIGTASLTNVRAPSIHGSPRIGGTITCDPGDWAGTQPIRFTYRWLRAGRPTGSAVGRYRVRVADLGASIACRVTATNGAVTRTARSRAVRIRA
jgi:hypothetical protein